MSPNIVSTLTTRSNTPDQLMKQSSFKKLLNSHSSVYNALTNPELDVSQDSTPSHTPDLKESQFSLTSWQSISNDSVTQMLRVPSSVLSIMSDDEDIAGNEEGYDKVNGNDNVMVFETEEEDCEDEFECNTLSMFIMPKISVPKYSNKRFQITVLSCDDKYKAETNQLIQNITSELKCRSITMRHLNLSSDNMKIDDPLIRNSDLIFIVNDGSFVFVDYLSSIYNGFIEDALPKLTIINMVTVNYFFNLFDLINNLKPYQIWKTTSLKHENLVNKFKTFVDLEVMQTSGQLDVFNESMSNESSALAVINSNSKSLVVSEKKKSYKQIEKKFKADLSLTTSFNDPLHLTSKFPFFHNLLSFIRKILFSSNNRILLICSFGIGIGIGLSSGLMSFFYYIYRPALAVEPEVKQKILMRNIINVMHDFFHFESLNDLGNHFDSYANSVVSVSSVIARSAKNGLYKVFGLIL